MTTIQINERGSMTLPMPLRKRFGLEKGGVLMAEPTEKGFILHPALSFPIEIYSDERILEFEKDAESLKKVLSKKKKK